MKIAFLGDRLGLATGGNLYVARVAEELAALGMEVTLITLVPPRDIPWPSTLQVISKTVDFSFGQRPEKGRIKSFLYSRLAAVTELKKLIRVPYDILYSVGGPSNIVSHLCQKGPFKPKLSIAVLFHLFRQVPYHQFLINPDTYTRPFQTLYHVAGDHLAKRFFVITVSEFWRQRLIRRGFAEEKIAVIPVGADGVDWPVIAQEEAKKELGFPGRWVIYTSPLRLNKGIMNVLKAVHQLKNKFPSLLVLATGVTDHQTQQQVQRFVLEHHMENHFRYVGLVPRARLPIHYAASDVVVLASLEEEGWGITLLEGMMAGKPVIGSPRGALPELVGNSGILLEKNTPQDLALAVEQLIRSPELRDRLSRAGPPHARQFSYQAAARAHLSLFEKLLDRS
jgi:glycosyltransferase involved in cell wall biosynthesis